MDWIRYILRQSKLALVGVGKVEFICGIVIYLLAGFDYLKPFKDIDLNLVSWQLPLMALGVVVLGRFIFVAPYLLWQEQRQKALSISKGVGVNFYSKQIGYLYEDLIENWSDGGVSTSLLSIFPRPRSIDAYKSLNELKSNFLIRESVRDDLKGFLGHFDCREVAMEMVFLKTIYDSKAGVKARQGDIKDLAGKLSEALSSVSDLDKPSEQ